MNNTDKTVESLPQPADGGDARPGSARWHLASHLRVWPVAVIGLAVDLWTKHWAFTHLPPDGGVVIIPHLMSFHRSLNTGALFGLGKGLVPLFIVASFLALGFVLFLFIHSSRDRWSLHVALGLVLAGALGNLYDRTFAIADVVRFTVNGRTASEPGKVLEETHRGILIGSWPEGRPLQMIRKEWNPQVHQQGVVRDFIRMEPRISIAGHTFDIWPWVFNIADALLVVGVGLLMLNFYWDRRAEKLQSAKPAVSDDPVPQ
jgi:lipoprotein signal peptidase